MFITPPPKSWTVFRCNPYWVATVSSSPWPASDLPETGSQVLPTSLPAHCQVHQVWCHFSTRQAHGWQGFAECHVETSEEIGIKGVAEWPTFQISPQETFNLFQPSVPTPSRSSVGLECLVFLVMFIQGFKKYVEAILFHDVKNSFCFLSKLPKSPKMYRLFAELYPQRS